MLLALRRDTGFSVVSRSACRAWRSVEGMLGGVGSRCSPFAQQTHGADRLCVRMAPQSAATLAHTLNTNSQSEAACSSGACCTLTASWWTHTTSTLSEEA